MRVDLPDTARAGLCFGYFSAILGAMGLFMLPPALVALPLKLILFVLADGWMLVSGMLLRSFSG